MVVDPTKYTLAVVFAQADLEQARADINNKIAMTERRQELTTLSTSIEEKQTFVSAAESTEAAYHQAQATLSSAKVDLSRTRIYSPVNGWITILSLQAGNYVTTGRRVF